jgi:hypothetical protein
MMYEERVAKEGELEDGKATNRKQEAERGGAVDKRDRRQTIHTCGALISCVTASLSCSSSLSTISTCL